MIHAAGIPNNRVHSSDPLRVYQTTVDGINNTLDAAAKLDGLRRFVNVSSCLVAGTPTRPGPLSEMDYFPIPAGALHSVYTDAKRSAESLAAIYRSQFRLPISTVRLFTLSGAYQELDRPWAMNSFFHDVLTGREMRIHGDGSARRSYLYGSDAAWGVLAALVRGVDGEVYNLGSGHAVSHLELATLIAQRVGTQARFALNTSPGRTPALDDLFPDVTATEARLGFPRPLRSRILSTRPTGGSPVNGEDARSAPDHWRAIREPCGSDGGKSLDLFQRGRSRVRSGCDGTLPLHGPLQCPLESEPVAPAEVDLRLAGVQGQQAGFVGLLVG